MIYLYKKRTAKYIIETKMINDVLFVVYTERKQNIRLNNLKKQQFKTDCCFLFSIVMKSFSILLIIQSGTLSHFLFHKKL